MIFLMLGQILFANELEFLHSLDEAKQEAQQEQKAVLIMFTQEGCPTCEYMKDIAFADEILSSYMQTNFILVELDINTQALPEGLKVFGTPTFYVLNYNGQKVGRQFAGGAKASEFLKILKEYKKQL